MGLLISKLILAANEIFLSGPSTQQMPYSRSLVIWFCLGCKVPKQPEKSSKKFLPVDPENKRYPTLGPNLCKKASRAFAMPNLHFSLTWNIPVSFALDSLIACNLFEKNLSQWSWKQEIPCFGPDQGINVHFFTYLASFIIK